MSERARTAGPCTTEDNSNLSPTDTPRRSTPFDDVRPSIKVALLYGVAVLVWMFAGDVLPGGRWFAVHLFTLGVLSNLVLAFMVHFAETLLHQPPDQSGRVRLYAFNLGALGVLMGVPTRDDLFVAGGAVAMSAAVVHLYVRLRRVRKAALTQRFAFLVRAYERACGAFLHGAILGGLLGSGLLPGAWAGTGRLAHLHVNVLGWGGLTLLSTLVVFGPTVLRAQLRDGAEATAATWLRRAATALTIGVLALLASAAPAPFGTIARLLAAAGLAVYAVGVMVLVRPLLTTAAEKRTRGPGLLLACAAVWFVLVACADTAIVATAQWRWLTAAGAGALAGVLLQAIAATLAYLAPMLFVAPDRRRSIQRRLDRYTVVAAVLLNAGVVFLVLTAAGVLP